MKITTISGLLPLDKELLINSFREIIGESKDHHSNQVLAVVSLTNLGKELGYIPYPEYPITFPAMKSGKGYIDLVWLKNNQLIYGFEVVNSAGGPRDIAKLALCPNGFLVQLRNKIDVKRINVIKAERMLNLPYGSLQKLFWEHGVGY